jgi:hypothetical protein
MHARAALSVARRGNEAATNHAVVILISDLGSRKLKPGMDRTAARAAIEDAAAARFVRSRKRVLLQVRSLLFVPPAVLLDSKCTGL